MSSPKKRIPSRPATKIPGDFSVRAGGAWIVTQSGERCAWETFLTECRGRRGVELLRGTTVIARISNPLPEETRP